MTKLSKPLIKYPSNKPPNFNLWYVNLRKFQISYELFFKLFDKLALLYFSEVLPSEFEQIEQRNFLFLEKYRFTLTTPFEFRTHFLNMLTKFPFKLISHYPEVLSSGFEQSLLFLVKIGITHYLPI